MTLFYKGSSFNMRVNSFKKIQKQVESYINSVFVIQDEIKNQIEILEQELSNYSKRWSNIRDSFCNGAPCICKTHPRYIEFYDKIDSINVSLNALYQQITKKRKDLSNKKEKELVIARLAKQKYHENRQKTVDNL